MEIKLTRDTYSPNSTIGKLYIDGVYFCNTLERVSTPIQVPNESAILEGRYEVIIDQSKRFNRLMPLLLDVPGREGIRIHIANVPHDLEGCIGLGYTRARDFIGQSKDAFNTFFAKLQDALRNGKVFIEITNSTQGRGVQPLS